LGDTARISILFFNVAVKRKIQKNQQIFHI